ncbi:hypothetical protein SO802_034740 [Lithocarpus litseifolius]|uniref:COP9 signalosome complex subunit 3 n=1 Tax=Lithocarpus litseifolius TaxID=425828 RepID=A0AAW2BMC7_9ROSI
MEGKEEPSEQQTEQERDRLRSSSSSSSRRSRSSWQRDPLDLDHLVLQIQGLSSSSATDRHVILKEAEESLRYDYESTQLSPILDQLDPSKHSLGYLYIINTRRRRSDRPEEKIRPRDLTFPICSSSPPIFISFRNEAAWAPARSRGSRGLGSSAAGARAAWAPARPGLARPELALPGLALGRSSRCLGSRWAGARARCFWDVSGFLARAFAGMGMICIGQQHFREALELLHNVVTAPMSTLNSIAVEVYKRYILVSLIHHGQFSISLPKYASSAAWGNLKSFCQQPYIELANSYSTREIAELKANIQKNEKNFIRDENHGLVGQVLSSMYKQKIQRLAQTDPSLSLEDIANEVQLNILEVAEMHDDNMVRFVEGPEQYKTCEMIERIGSSIQRIMSLSRKLTTMEEQISCESQYLAQFNRDRISEFPELVLSCILSKLTMKDVVKIGIQSRRWVNIRFLRTNLNFDVPNMFHSINDMPEFSYFPFVFGNNKNRGKPPFDNEVLNIFARIRHELVRRVDQLLLSFRGEKISSLRVCFFFDHRSTSSLNNWIHRAISLEVEEMNILLSNKPYFSATVPEDKRYCFPHKLFSGHSTLKQLHLELAVLKPFP